MTEATETIKIAQESGIGGGVTIGRGGRLHAVDEPPQEPKVGWPKGRVPFPTIKKTAQNSQNGQNWRGIVTTFGEICGIAAISAGTSWYSLGAGLIVAGIGVFAVSFVSGLPE